MRPVLLFHYHDPFWLVAAHKEAIKARVPNGEVEVILSVEITGRIYGLRPGLHGFHVHERGTFGRDCTNAGPHFNPFNQHHAGPSDAPRRHVGDLGNIYANNWGVANLAIYDNFIRMRERRELSILGRGIVVHADPDDLGRGGNGESLETGNAGARLACCQIIHTAF
ncbi:superoxide dismutase [Cu-Zn]-like [Mytilus edulis]|uniref:superoxide dismutase [Cu-Zn]-like n=1 Tax=Mytilus edulis TaxID=6550 RepID=UPI0039F02D41